MVVIVTINISSVKYSEEISQKRKFGISRHTVSERLKKGGVTMRGQSPGYELIDSMVGLYESGLSLASVGNRVGTSPGTLRHYLLTREIQMRDSHGR